MTIILRATMAVVLLIAAAPVARGAAPEAATLEAVAYERLMSDRRGLGLSPRDGFRLLRTHTDLAGGSHLTFEQTQSGVPIFAARAIVHFGADGALRSITPSLAGGPSAAEVWSVGEAEAAVVAGAPGVRAERAILHDGVIKARPGKRHAAWAVDDRVSGYMVFVDSQSGAVLERVPTRHDALRRVVTLQGQEAREEGEPPHADPAVNSVYDHTGETYRLFQKTFGRDSYDGNGRTMRGNVILASPICPNAWWDGSSTSYCRTLETDDVVGHEWLHAYSEYTHGLIYWCESGALNESYSDIFGELVDLLNGQDRLAGDNSRPFPEGQRWLLAEDSVAVHAAFGRDMWNPMRYRQPARLSEAQMCAGVHTNSGISNHAFAMLADGKTFNGRTVAGIGLTKAAHIYYQAMVAHQTPSTTFAQHQRALMSSCHELAGIDLPALMTGEPSGEVIGPGDCAQVQTATDAAEMRLWRGSVISGTVEAEATGEPVDGACVLAHGPESIHFVYAWGGRFEMEGLTPGEYKIEIDPCTDGLAPEWYDDRPDFESADAVFVGEGEHVSGIDVALAPRGSTTGLDVRIGEIDVTRVREGTGGLPAADRITIELLNMSLMPGSADIGLSACSTVSYRCNSDWGQPMLDGSPSQRVSFLWEASAWVGSVRFDIDVYTFDYWDFKDAWSYAVAEGPSVYGQQRVTYEGPA